jgi:hypothetical protein
VFHRQDDFDAGGTRADDNNMQRPRCRLRRFTQLRPEL